MCVLATVLGAVDLGWRIMIVTDGVCSSSDEGHNSLLTLYSNLLRSQDQNDRQRARVLAAMAAMKPALPADAGGASEGVDDHPVRWRMMPRPGHQPSQLLCASTRAVGSGPCHTGSQQAKQLSGKATSVKVGMQSQNRAQARCCSIVEVRFPVCWMAFAASEK